MSTLGPQTLHLPGFLLPHEADLLADIRAIEAVAPFRYMTTPKGNPLRVAMTSCGSVGWVADTTGYRYEKADPETGLAWPALPPRWKALAQEVAADVGFAGFDPDTCLMNQYLPGDALALHQDKDEQDFSQPVVSFSLGIPATFLWGGMRRTDSVRQVRLQHGDAFVWGGVDRLRFHGILPIPSRAHPQVGARRLNLTFRKAV